MPTFDFKCRTCDVVNEHSVRNAEETITCPLCDAVMDRLPPLVSLGGDKGSPGSHCARDLGEALQEKGRQAAAEGSPQALLDYTRQIRETRKLA